MNSTPLERKVIGAAIEVHRHLGPGLLESTYLECLVYELGELGLKFLIEPFVSSITNASESSVPFGRI